ncbi:MAG: hypothetical protein EU551_02105 [Promethearchaeota archaeon]|nr:MAG: hypothetical protein EU551_02105 [Candidatus Lokiarchaeota archaeon]
MGVFEILPGIGILLIIIGIIIGIWLILHVEAAYKFSAKKVIAAIISLSLCMGFGIEFLMIFY